MGGLVGQLIAAKRPPLTMGELVGRLAAVAFWAVADEVRRHEFVQNADPRFGRSRMAFQRFRTAGGRLESTLNT
jgi:hypothetical protein